MLALAAVVNRMGEIESGAFYKHCAGRFANPTAQLGDNGVTHNPYTDAPADTAVLALAQDNKRIDQALLGEKVEVILAESHFYVESGGQVQ